MDLSLVLGLGAWLTLSSAIAEAEPVIDCSMVELIARSAECAGRNVRTIGYVVIEGEESAIYLSETDARAAISTNGLWLDLRGAGLTDLTIAHVSGHYAIVEGTFEPLARGTLPHSGRLFKIERLDRWHGRRSTRD